MCAPSQGMSGYDTVTTTVFAEDGTDCYDQANAGTDEREENALLISFAKAATLLPRRLEMFLAVILLSPFVKLARLAFSCYDLQCSQVPFSPILSMIFLARGGKVEFPVIPNGGYPL